LRHALPPTLAWTGAERSGPLFPTDALSRAKQRSVARRLALMVMSVAPQIAAPFGVREHCQGAPSSVCCRCDTRRMSMKVWRVVDGLHVLRTAANIRDCQGLHHPRAFRRTASGRQGHRPWRRRAAGEATGRCPNLAGLAPGREPRAWHSGEGPGVHEDGRVAALGRRHRDAPRSC